MSTGGPAACSRCGFELLEGELEHCLDRPLCVRCAYAAEHDHRQDRATLPVAAALRRALERSDVAGDARRLALALIEELER